MSLFDRFSTVLGTDGICIYGNLPKHGCVLQESDCDVSPTQSAPPFAGRGLLHDLVLTLDPPPQVLLHAL